MTGHSYGQFLKYLLVLALAAQLASGTAQEPDELVLKGKSYAIFTNPLEAFLKENLGLLPRSSVTSTARWRGYVAKWRIQDDHLELVDVFVLAPKKEKDHEVVSVDVENVSVYHKMFPDSKAIIATWFSGHIIIPDGKMTQYRHMGYASQFERYIVLRLEKGRLTQQLTLDENGFIRFREAQFNRFKKTDQYKKALEEATVGKDAMESKDAEEFLRQFYSEVYMSAIYD